MNNISKLIYRATIGIAPRTKKNASQILINKTTGRPFIMPSKLYKEYEKSAWAFLTGRPQTPIDYPVTVTGLFYMPSRRKVDLNNLLEALTDVLTKYEVLADDNYTIVASHDGSRVFYDKANPRTELFITTYEEEQK